MTGAPTSSKFIAEQIKKMIPQLYENNTGLYHLVPNGSCSRFNFAKQIIDITNPHFNIENLHAVKTSDYPSRIKRPSNSCLDNQKIKAAFMLKFKSWEVELNKVINEA